MKLIKNKTRDFSAVESGIGFALHSSIKTFYSSNWGDCTYAIYKGLKIALVDVQNDDDFVRLQENILGHLVMLQRLKLSPTIFIATVKQDNRLISIDNNTGEVIYEYLGTSKRVILEPTLSDFIRKIEMYA